MDIGECQCMGAWVYLAVLLEVTDIEKLDALQAGSAGAAYMLYIPQPGLQNFLAIID